jgi:membrane dipeptidase
MKQRTAPMVLLSMAMAFGSQALAASDPISEQARKLHFSSLVLDTHIDTTPKLQTEWRFTEEHADGSVDLPRMQAGGLNGLFFSIYMPGTVTGPKAVSDAVERIAAVHQLAMDLPDQVAVCVTADDIRRARKQNKIAALIGMEGGHMINNSLPTLRMYAKLGVRYLTLTHSIHTDWADSSGQEPKHNGLTPFGKEVVRELNKLGVLVDVSHVSDKTFWDALAESKAPMIASHSSVRAIAAHPRNMTDDMIKALAAKGGVIQINYLDLYLDQARYEYMDKAAPKMRELQTQYPGAANTQRRLQALVPEFGPAPIVSWEKIIEHIDYAVKLVGVDHVGLGSDFDGGPLPKGMTNASELPKITEALLRKGYSEKDIKKILGLNTLRLLEQAETVAAELAKQ